MPSTLSAVFKGWPAPEKIGANLSYEARYEVLESLGRPLVFGMLSSGYPTRSRAEPERDGEHSYAERCEGNEWNRVAAGEISQAAYHERPECSQHVADEEGHRSQPTSFLRVGGVINRER